MLRLNEYNVNFQIAGIGHVNSFGLIYNDFIIDTQSTAKSLTTAHGVFAIMLAIGGNVLPKYLSIGSSQMVPTTKVYTVMMTKDARKLILESIPNQLLDNLFPE